MGILDAPMRSLTRLLFLFLTVASVANATRSTSIPPVNQPLSGPEAALERFADGYRDRSPASVLASLTSDFQFHSKGDSVLKFTSGVSREDEARVIDGVLRGVIRGGDTLAAPADSVGMILDGISEGVDPEHPDSTLHYEVLIVRRFELGFRTSRGARFSISSPLNVFHVVRGDVAVLTQDQRPDSTRWYVRRWLEDVSAVKADLAKREGGCGEAPVPAPGARPGNGRTPALPTVLAVHALTNPACAKLEVRCDLPGPEPARVDVYDVSGRLVNRRDIEIAAAGTISIEAGRGAALDPGVYWVRVGQGRRSPVTRMVVVAR
jgi:hypothetical protein